MRQETAERTLVVWCPDWPVQAAVEAAAVEADEPVAVVSANRVVACSPAARREGVVRGLRRREAQARCPDLRVLPLDPAGEARVFEPVVAAVEAFAPRIEVVRPGVCALATRGPSRYFGGDDALAARVVAAVGHECRVGVADGRFAAGLAARVAGGDPTVRASVRSGSAGVAGGLTSGHGRRSAATPDAEPSGGRGAESRGRPGAKRRTTTSGRTSRPATAPGTESGGGPGSEPSGTPGTESGGGPGSEPSGTPGAESGGGRGAEPSGTPGAKPSGGPGTEASGPTGAGPSGGPGVEPRVVPGVGAERRRGGDDGAAPERGRGGDRAVAPAAQSWCVVPPGQSARFLAPFPVAVLERPELADVLRRLGVPTLGALAALPAADVVARFGRDGEVAHRLARGLDERPLAARIPPPDLIVQCELDPPALRVDVAAFAAKGLADELHERLAAQGLACTRVLVEAETEHGEHLARLWRHEGALDAAAVAARVRWQLDGWLAGTAPRTGGSGTVGGAGATGLGGPETAATGAAKTAGLGGPETATTGGAESAATDGASGAAGQGGSESAATDGASGAAATGGAAGPGGAESAATGAAGTVRGRAISGGDRPTSGLTLLRLVPDEVVPATGRQLGFWGGAAAADERAARALARVQGTVGHDAVVTAVLSGGRNHIEQVTLVPWGEPRLPGRPGTPGDGPVRVAGRVEIPPWPGRIPSPAPALVHPDPLPAELLDGTGGVLAVNGRGLARGAPARLSVAGAPARAVVGWAGPWPLDERWWDTPVHRRRARLQVLTEDDDAYLLALEGGRWWVQATYD